MANFIVLKRPGPPTREVLVNLDQILMVQPGQGTGGSAILFGREHVVTFEEDFATVIRRIQTGPYVERPGVSMPRFPSLCSILVCKLRTRGSNDADFRTATLESFRF
jgi:hypothetical protein